MPNYDYRCNECGKTYDVFHKVREVIEDVICPSCGATDHTRLISAPSLSTGSKGSMATFGAGDGPPCADGGCCTGSCEFN